MKRSAIVLSFFLLAAGAVHGQCNWTPGTASIHEACGNVTIGAAAGTAPQKLVVWDGPSHDAAAVFSGDGALTGVLLDARAANGRKWLVASNASAGTEAGLGKFSIRDQNAGATRLVIDTTGFLGIGTVTPDAILTLGGGERFRLANNPSVRLVDLDMNALIGATTATNGANYRIDLREGQPTHQWWTRPAGSPLPGTLEYAKMVLTEGGNLGVGVLGPANRLEVNGNGHFIGNVTATGNIAVKYQDLAEWVPASADLAPGTLVVLNPDVVNQVMPSHRAYDTRVAGVVSAQPGVILGEAGQSKEQIATTGRVKMLADATRGAIAIGDLLVSSDTPGAAMKSEAVTVGGIEMHRPGTIVGKALEPLGVGRKEILVLLSLQ